MVNHNLLNLINKVLEPGKPTARENYSYHCPFCSHPKRKLEINLNEDNIEHYQRWHCWTCNKRGKKIYSLFKEIGVESSILSEVGKYTEKNYLRENPQYKTKSCIPQLPDAFTSLLNVPKSHILARRATSYIKSRKLSNNDICKYNIGFCSEGPYKDCIIIPSYNESGSLNFFVTKNINSKYYQNPELDKNIIFFENQINWNLPVIICEGPFDAIAIKRNAIPLLGKSMSKALMEKLVSSSIEKIYIVLDNDALKKSVEYIEYFMNANKKVYWVNLPEKDPGKLGFDKFQELVFNTQKITFRDLLELKLLI